jgi:hypothetical protein
MTSSLAPRHGRLYQRMGADAAALSPPPGPVSSQLPGDGLIPGPAAASGSRP